MQKIDSIMKRFGRTVSRADRYGNTVKTAKCVIQPLRYKNKMYLEGIPTDIGINEAGYYLLLAPADFELKDIDNGGYLTDGNIKYHVDRAEKIYYREQVAYTWAVIKAITEGDFPFYDHFNRGD